MALEDRTPRIHLQVMWNRLLAVVEEQARALIRTAFSPVVRECGDLSAGVFDTRGRMLAQAVTGTPGHVNSMAESVRHFIAHFGLDSMRPGDVYVTNDPWKGTGHLNDLVVTTPAFHRGRLVGLFSSTCHITDVGGLGFGPNGKDIFMEGIAIPFLRLVEEGHLNGTLMAILKANSRMPIELEGDVHSLIASNDTGCRRLADMMTEFQIATLDELAHAIIESSRLAVTAAIDALPPGTYRGKMTLDGYEAPVELRAALTIGRGTIIVDYEGSSPMSDFGINVPMSYTSAYTCFGLRCVLAPEIQNNAGSLSPFIVRAPEGSIVNATPPAPVSSRHLIGQMLPFVVFHCLRQVLPDRVPAEGAGSLWNTTFRRGRIDKSPGFAVTLFSNGGTGARPGIDGLSATAYPSGVKGSPVEVIESIAPLLFHRKQLRVRSGGAGTWRGGHGLDIEVESRDVYPIELVFACDRIQFPASGSDGGQAGASGALQLGAQKLPGKGMTAFGPGQRIRILTPGGGGLGEAGKRAPSAVALDILNEVI